MDKEIEKAHNALQAIKLKYNGGKISQEEAKKLAQPYLDIVNEKAKEIADRYGRKFYPITFINYMR